MVNLLASSGPIPIPASPLLIFRRSKATPIPRGVLRTEVPVRLRYPPRTAGPPLYRTYYPNPGAFFSKFLD